MAQFDVFDNPNVGQRAGYPYVVVIQSQQLDGLRTRLAIPLARAGVPLDKAPRRLSVPVALQGETLWPAVQLTGAYPLSVLQRPRANLRDQASVFLDALDAVISGV